MTISAMLTILLCALAKNETEDLFDWVLWEQFKNELFADGMGQWLAPWNKHRSTC